MYLHVFNSFTAAGDFNRHENHIDTRNSAVKELIQQSTIARTYLQFCFSYFSGAPKDQLEFYTHSIMVCFSEEQRLLFYELAVIQSSNGCPLTRPLSTYLYLPTPTLANCLWFNFFPDTSDSSSSLPSWAASLSSSGYCSVISTKDRNAFWI